MKTAWGPSPPEAPAPDTVAVWRLDLDAWPLYLTALSPEEAAQVERLPAVRRTRAFAVRGALRYLLGACAKHPPEALVFGTGAHGKPFLQNAPALRFNLSHAGALALVAVSPAHEVGVDVERVRPLADVLGVARRVLGADAAARLASLPASEQQAAFFAAWTRHEALAKGLGIGLARPLPADLGPWTVTPLDVAPGYGAALACALPGPVECHMLLPP